MLPPGTTTAAEFRACFQARDGERFLARFRFEEGGHTEFMWVFVDAIQETTLRGRLDNKPFRMKQIASGDPVERSLDELQDWVVWGWDGSWSGGFTEAVIERQQRRKLEGLSQPSRR